MEVTFAIYKDTHHTMQTPFGAHTIIKHDKIDSMTMDVPDDISEEIKKYFIFNTETYCEGIGAIQAQDEFGNVRPQTMKFLFDEDIKDVKTAFQKFDEYLQKKIDEIVQEQEKQQSSITPATEQDLQMIDDLSNKAGGQGGIIMP